MATEADDDVMMEDEAFFDALRRHVANWDLGATLQLVDDKKEQIATLGRTKGMGDIVMQETVLLAVVTASCTVWWTAEDDDDPTSHREFVLTVAQRCTQYDPLHIARMGCYQRKPTTVLKFLLDEAENHMIERHASVGIPAAEAILITILELYSMAPRTHWEPLLICKYRHEHGMGDWASYHPLHHLILISLRIPLPTTDLTERLCRFLQEVGTILPEAFLVGQHTVLRYLCGVLGAVQKRISLSFDSWSAITLTVLQCNPTAASVVSVAPDQTIPHPPLKPIDNWRYDWHTREDGMLPLHDILANYEDDIQATEVVQAVFQAYPAACLIRNSMGRFAVNIRLQDYRGDEDSTFVPQWLIEGYIEMYDKNRALPDDSEEKICEQGNALHVYLNNMSGLFRLQALVQALPPNHPMVTEHDEEGKTPLHVLIERPLDRQTTRETLVVCIQLVVQRHPETLHCRSTCQDVHPLELFCTRFRRSWDNEGPFYTETLHLTTLFRLIRNDPIRSLDNMQGEPTTSSTTKAPTKHKKRQREQY